MAFLIKIEIDHQKIYKTIVEEKKEISLGSGPKDTIYVQDLSPSQIKMIIKKNLLKVTGKNILSKNPFLIEKCEQSTSVSESRSIHICWVDYSGKSEIEYSLPYRGIVRIGKSSQNEISINNPLISRNHATLIIDDGKVRVEDGNNGKPSSNGIYLNGTRISKAAMKSGDCLDLVNHSIRLLNTKLLFDNVEGILTIKQMQNEEEATSSNISNAVMPTMDNRKTPDYRRSPRIREGLPQNEIVLAKAPTKAHKFQKRRGMFTSLLSSGAMIGASVATGMVSPALLAARAAGLVAPVANMAVNSGDNKKGKKEYLLQEQKRREKYGAYIEDQKALIKLTADQQRKIITNENPDTNTCFDIVKSLNPQLWERRPDNSDFLDVRVGMGYEPICVNIKTPMDAMGFQMEDDDVQEIAKQIVEETRIVDDIPARVPVKSYGTIGVIGNRTKVTELLRNMLVELTTLHFYEDVRIIGLFDKSEYNDWEMLKWLPHIWDEEKQSRFIAFDYEDAERISDTFCEIFRQRTSVRESYESVSVTPHFIFILGSHSLTKKLKVMSYLLENDSRLGVTTFFAYNLDNYDSLQQRTFLPPECQYVIDTDDAHGSCAYEFLRAEKKFMFTLDPKIGKTNFDWFCRHLSSIKVEAGIGKMELPGGITFLEGMGISNVKELPTWRDRKENITHLSAPIAIQQNGKMLEIDIGDFNLPPVSLVAGMSGSGKSEFLKTWILSLSVKYSPEEISFVIIDYKGGSMAQSVSGLPHISGMITDIENGDIMRPLTSIAYEIERREQIFKKYNVTDLRDYILNGYSGIYPEKLPFLIIVCDEFAELKLQHKEFLTTLISIARRGRSLGIRLILATQSPAGVVDQDLFDNSSYQICLKVQNAAASKSMIQRPDASRITQNGRAYVRSGNDEIFEFVQSFWTGAPYLGNREKKASTGNQVRLVELSGQRIKTVWEEKTRFKSDRNELQAVIRYISRLAEEDGFKRTPCLWKPELPKACSLMDIHLGGGFDGYDWRPAFDGFRVPIGLYDMPELQRQGIQFIDFEQNGHHGIYGLPGTGKTTLLKTIIMSLGLYCSPDDVNIYIVDLGSQTLNIFSKMPHIGGIALGSEEDKLKKIANYFGELLVERKKIFARKGISTLKNYREQIDRKMPAIVLVIDNFLPLFDLCPDFEQLLYKLANEGASYGIYILFSSNNTTGIRYKLLQNIKGGIAYEMNSKTDYTDVVGRVDNPERIQNIKGRAYTKQSFGPVLFQTALYAPGANEMEQSRWVKSLTESMDKYWDGDTVTGVQFVPEEVTSQLLVSAYTDRNLIPAGFYHEDAQAAFLNFKDKNSALILGNDGNSISQYINSMIKMLKASAHSSKIYVIDSISGRLSDSIELANTYVRANEADAIDEMITNLIRELIQRQKVQMEQKNLEGSSFDNEKFLMDFPQLCVFIDDLSEFVELIDQHEGIYKRVNALLKNASGLGVIIVAGGSSEKIGNLYLSNSIVSKFTSAGMGLAVSGSSKDNVFLPQGKLSISDKSNPLHPSDAWLYFEGNVKKIKIMSSEV